MLPFKCMVVIMWCMHFRKLKYMLADYWSFFFKTRPHWIDTLPSVFDMICSFKHDRPLSGMAAETPTCSGPPYSGLRNEDVCVRAEATAQLQRDRTPRARLPHSGEPFCHRPRMQSNACAPSVCCVCVSVCVCMNENYLLFASTTRSFGVSLSQNAWHKNAFEVKLVVEVVHERSCLMLLISKSLFF